jgi:hypothetical protein
MKEKIPNNTINLPEGNSENITRRRFISSCSACAACMAIAPIAMVNSSCSSANGSRKIRIRVLYSLHAEVQTQPDWPNVGFDFRPAMGRINKALTSEFKNIEFIPTLATGAADAEKIVEQDKLNTVDGYIVYQMNCWNMVVQTIAKTGKPVLYADFQFGGSGGFLVYNSSFLNGNNPNVGFVASSRIEDMLAAVGCFKSVIRNGSAADFSAATAKVRTRLTAPAGKYNPVQDDLKTLTSEECIYRLKNSKILAVRDQGSGVASPVMGIPLEYIPFSEVNAAWSAADKDEAVSTAEQWQKTALEVIGVPFETLQTSAAMYLGMKAVLKAHGANAITINCLGGFYGGHIHAYPCLGFYELCNEGMVGGCECDVRSAATMLAFSTMTNGRPGFISDPVIDTAKRQIIYAHCVASNKVFGPHGSANPIKIMTHSEDRNGASVRSLLPVNYLTTTLEINNDNKEILLHQAIALDNDPDDRACRTKLCAEPVGDIEKLFTTWEKWGWHRVTFYGDLKAAAYALAEATGWKVIEEA